jgi:hypothetical protein
VTRTGDLPTCSIVPQPTTLPRAPSKVYVRKRLSDALPIHSGQKGESALSPLLFSLILYVIKIVQEAQKRLKCYEAHQFQVHSDCEEVDMYVNTQKIRYILWNICSKQEVWSPRKSLLGNGCVAPCSGVSFCAVRAEAI